MSKFIVLITISFALQSCNWQKKVWNFSIVNPPNNSTITQNTSNAVNVSGKFYLENAKLTIKDKTRLKKKFNSLSIQEQKEIQTKYNNLSEDEKKSFWDWIFGRPTLNDSIYCNGIKGTVRQNGDNGSWHVDGVKLNIGTNEIRCAYTDKNGIKTRKIVVNYVQNENQRPIVRFECDNSTPLMLTCDASSSYDNDGNIVKYKYIVGNQVYENNNPVATFSFYNSGNTDISLEVYDNKGAKSETLTKSIFVKNYPSQTNTIGTNGGKVTLEGIADVNISGNTFSQNTSVTLSETKDPEVDEVYGHSNVILNDPVRNSTELKIILESSQPSKDIAVQLYIPEDFHLNSSIDNLIVFARFYEYSENGELDWFHSINYNYDEQTKTLEVILPPTAFTEKRRSDGKFEAQLIIVKDQINKDDIIRKVLPESGCEGLISVGKPLETDRLLRTSPWSDSRVINGVDRGHFGIDYDAKIGTKVLAGFDGVVDRVKTQEDGYGLYIAIRNQKTGMTVIYAHLYGSFVSKGDTVQRGEVIGLSGNSGRSTNPHLHVTYSIGFPYHQGVNRSIDKINPEPCITVACFDVEDINNSPSVDFDPRCSSGPIHKLEWSFENGAGQSELSCTIENHTDYFANGTYTGVLTVTDYWGHVDVYKKGFSVDASTGDKISIWDKLQNDIEYYAGIDNKQLPFQFQMNPTSGIEPLQVFFNASSVPSSVYVHTYKWKFGLNDEIKWCAPTYEKTFISGIYNIEVEALDSNGDTFKSGSQTLIVDPQTGDK